MQYYSPLNKNYFFKRIDLPQFPYMFKIWSAASRSVILTWSLTEGYNLAKSSVTKSWSSAANSTPVGPLPTTTKCSILFLSSSLIVGRVALSKQSISVLRILWASSTSCIKIVFSCELATRCRFYQTTKWKLLRTSGNNYTPSVPICLSTFIFFNVPKLVSFQKSTIKIW